MRKRPVDQGLFRGWLPAPESKAAPQKLQRKRGELGRVRKRSKSVKSMWELRREGSEVLFNPPVEGGRASYMDADDSVLQELATILDIPYSPRSSPKLLLSPRLSHRTLRLKRNPLIHTAASYGLVPLRKPLVTSKSAPKSLLSHRKV